MGFTKITENFSLERCGPHLGGRSSGGGGGSRRAGPYGSTHFCGVQVVVDKGLNDGGQVVFEEGDALFLKILGAQESSHGVTQLPEISDDLILGRLGCDEVVNISHDVDTNVTGEVALVLGEGEGRGQEGGEDEGGLHGGGGAGLG